MNAISKLLYLLLIIGTIYWSFLALKPSVSTAQKLEKTTGFSTENALGHLKEISKESHFPGTKAHKAVQNYLASEFEKLGLETEIQTQVAFRAKWFVGSTTENIIAKIKGTEEGKALLLLSHYDSNPHSAIGSSDAGSGVVTILEAVRAFLAKNKQPKNDIIILLSDAEEIGLLGAQAFVDFHPWTKNVGLVLNFEARGSGGPSYMLMETNGKNSKLLAEFKKAKPNFIAANSLMYSIYKMLPNDTDLTVFREDANINGFNFAFIGDHFDYHTAQDNYERLDRESLIQQADYLMATLPYFANSDLSNLDSDKDLVYINFPFLKLLTYPFSWVLPMLLIALGIFIVLVFLGISYGKLTFKGLFKGFIPFLSSLIIAPLIAFGLWKLLLIIHPHYNDMLHGFTYNGYQYIIAFAMLTFWILFKIYNYFFKDISQADLLIAPITFWLVINGLVYQYLQGAAFFILPVFIALLILAALLFMDVRKKSKPVLFALLSIPTIYIFAPLVKMFPVGLGLKMLFISALFIVLLFGLMVPIFHQEKKKNNLQRSFGFLAILFFGVATFNSGFSTDKKRPNSLVYFQNEETKMAYFGTYNTTFDAYISRKLGDNYSEGNIKNAITSSKYGSTFKYHTRTDNKQIKSSEISMNSDTVFNGKRHLNFTIKPQRELTKVEILSKKGSMIDSLFVNNVLTKDRDKAKAKNGTFLIYYFANQDKDLNLKFQVEENKSLEFILNEVSNDLLTHPKFNIIPRDSIMMPMPFVTNDAIITSKMLRL
ncbi:MULTISPECIES: M20/M25/M40 family metallo-hydrolase [Tenacibaculum]|uniref:M20/M25/M40 family metallo-hydrolase n=1 Tax=Tenacibaculum TaxID=104267 RepID=UPI001F0A65E0|nr:MULTISPECIES: M20/M25/M40 family metallo-hydrolase [Tenacibaculum]MCH3881564.1 M20/M25/M40 family metallo-hydrolase [Tenacibaculum aquimarinum]MDO6598841.1 M20/M25/M40 family metallo-hydrolase [Tenacibaculum sp. 1_MG-2023]